ncbi:hypothetical protein ACFU6M_30845 [Streptomyces bottropensis]
MNGLPTDTDLVTVTAGGNDLGYIGSTVLLGTRRADSRPALSAGHWPPR